MIFPTHKHISLSTYHIYRPPPFRQTSWSPFSSPAAEHRKHLNLDSIDEDERSDEDDEEEGGGPKQGATVVAATPEQYDGGRAAFSAAALAGLEYYQASNESYQGIHGSNASSSQYSLPPPSPTPSASSRESKSSSLFGSIPQRATSSSFDDYDYEDYPEGDYEDEDEYDDLRSEHSSDLDFSKSPSSHSTSKTGKKMARSSDRLAKFEREQELLFEQKRDALERELSNVLERNAVKSVRIVSYVCVCVCIGCI